MAENLLLCVFRERERESEIREKAARLKEVNPKVSIYERFSKRDLVISIKGEGGGRARRRFEIIQPSISRVNTTSIFHPLSDSIRYDIDLEFATEYKNTSGSRLKRIIFKLEKADNDNSSMIII